MIKTFIEDNKLWTTPDQLTVWEKNPRDITPEDFEKLKKDLKNTEQFKPMIVTEDGIVLGGNMRLKGHKAIGTEKLWISIVKAHTDQEKLFYALRDNERYGYYVEDILSKLKTEMPDFDWGAFSVDVDTPITIEELFSKLEEEEFDKDYSQNLGEIVYEPNETNHTVSDLYEEEHKFDADIESLKNEDIKKMLRLRAFNFTQFNYEKIADYYAYQATPEEQRVMEKLALVLIDRNKLIENGFSKLINHIDDSPEDYETE